MLIGRKTIRNYNLYSKYDPLMINNFFPTRFQLTYSIFIKIHDFNEKNSLNAAIISQIFYFLKAITYNETNDN